MPRVVTDGGGGGLAAGVLGTGLGLIWRAIREEPRVFAVALAGSTAFGLLTVVGAVVVGEVVGRVVVPAIDSGRADARVLAVASAVILTLSLLKVCGIFGRRLGAGAMQFRLQATYRRQITRRYLDLPLSWHRRHATGTLLSNANSDVEALWFPIAPMPFAVGTIIMLLAAIGTLFAIDWSFALVGLAVFPALFGLNVVYSRLMSPRIARAQALRADTSAIAHESFDGALVVKTMGREEDETTRFTAKAVELRDAMISVGRLRGLFDPILEALPSLGTLTALVVGVIRMRQGAVELADVVIVAFLFTVLAFPVRAIGWVLTELPRSVVGWQRVNQVLTATGDMPYGDAALPSTTGPVALTMHGVCFSYDDRSGDGSAEGAGVLHDVTLEVPAGRTVALVGPTGSGKSTIASLSARLVDPASGSVRYNGVDARDLSAEELADTVALVPQIPFVFDDSVRGNVTLGRPRVDAVAEREALGLAQADGFVDRLAEGTETMVGERGTSLSGGQRQRLTLARALAGRPRLLVLDDATSAVDPRVEAAILRGLRSGGSSILVVAYRRATIALADEVVYLERGRVVARGRHADLLATVPGYTDLVTAYERAEAEREREHAYDEDDEVVDDPDILDALPGVRA